MLNDPKEYHIKYKVPEIFINKFLNAIQISRGFYLK